MSKRFAILATALSGLALAAGTAAHGQGAPPQAPQITPQFLADLNDTIYRGMELCQMAAREVDGFAPNAFAGEGWTLERTGPATSAEGKPYQSVILRHFPQVELDVRHFPNHTSCSVRALVLNLGHADAVQMAVEQRWDARLHEEGELKEAVLASVNASWGDGIDVRSHDLFYDDEFLFEITHMLVGTTPVFNLDLTLLEHATFEGLSEEEKLAARKEAANRPVAPPPPLITASPAGRQQYARVSPPRPRGPVIETRSAPPLPSLPAPKSELGLPASTDDFADMVQLCMDVVSPQQELETGLLIEDRWGYTQPRLNTNDAGVTFESVNYHKDDLTISLQDFGMFVQCRAGGRVTDLAQLAEIKAVLSERFGAEDARTLDRLAPWVANIKRGAPSTNFDNIFAIGDYSIEIFTKTLPAAQLGLEEPENIHMVLISTVPFPSNFQSRTAD